MTKSLPCPTPLLDDLQHLGKNRNKNNGNLEIDLAIQFLKNYEGSQATFNSYRRELERFLHWSSQVKQQMINQHKREDMEEFIRFCQKPPKTWIGLKNVSRFMINENAERVANCEWRPFVVSISKKERLDGKLPDKNNYQLSQSGIQAIFSILSSFYNFLVQEGFSQFNPLMQIRQKSKFIRKQQSKRPIRRLSELQWQYVIDTAETMANTDAERHERTLFIMSALYGMYLRISELAASPRWLPQMGHFYRDQNNHWWFKTVGKGNKERDITVSDAMLNALKRYRKFLGLTLLPTPGEATPLITKTKGIGAITDTRHIRRIVQNCFDQAITKLNQDTFIEEAEQLKMATVHWLRHTGISDDVKIRPREHVRDDAGHSSSAITDRYIDVELIARQQSAKKKLINHESY